MPIWLKHRMTFARKYWRYLVGGAVLVAAGVVIPKLTQPVKVDFTITADSGTVALRTYCGQRLTWDLPRGTIRESRPLELPPELSDKTTIVEDVTPPLPDPMAVTLDGDAIARLSVLPAGRLSIVWTALPEGASAGVITAGDRSIPVTNTVSYVSTRAVGLHETERDGFTLRLSGRVLVGDKVPEGSGAPSEIAPLLAAGTITARVKVGFLSLESRGAARKALLHENVEPGDLVDTHPKYSALDLLAPNTDCASGTSSWAATGYVAPSEGGLLRVVLQRTGSEIGVSHLGADPFELRVPRWSAWLAKPGVQIAIALFVFGFWLIDRYLSLRKLREKDQNAQKEQKN